MKEQQSSVWGPLKPQKWEGDAHLRERAWRREVQLKGHPGMSRLAFERLRKRQEKD